MDVNRKAHFGHFGRVILTVDVKRAFGIHFNVYVICLKKVFRIYEVKDDGFRLKPKLTDSTKKDTITIVIGHLFKIDMNKAPDEVCKTHYRELTRGNRKL